MMKYVKGLKYRIGLTTSGMAFGRYKIGCRKNPIVVNIETNSFVSRRNTCSDARVSDRPVNNTNDISTRRGKAQAKTTTAFAPTAYTVAAVRNDTATAAKSSGDANDLVGSSSRGNAICFTTPACPMMLPKPLFMTWQM